MVSAGMTFAWDSLAVGVGAFSMGTGLLTRLSAAVEQGGWNDRVAAKSDGGTCFNRRDIPLSSLSFPWETACVWVQGGGMGGSGTTLGTNAHPKRPS